MTAVICLATQAFLPIAWAEDEKQELLEILEKVSASRDVDDQIALLKEAIALGISTRDWLYSMPRDAWLALIWHSLGNRYLDRRAPDKTADIDHAIEAFETASSGLDPKMYTKLWADNRIALGRAYTNRLRGDPRDNRQRAVGAFESLLAVLTEHDSPAVWAETHARLGLLYLQAPVQPPDDPADRAIRAFVAAETVYTRDRSPEEWAQLQSGLGSAYIRREAGDRSDNLEVAIGKFESALQVLSREKQPTQWAATQSNLGAALLARIRGNTATNIERAIAAYHATLTVYTRDHYPALWARAQASLGHAYRVRHRGSRADNLEEAIVHSEAALSVLTRDTVPDDWADTLNELGQAYAVRIRGQRGDNVEKSLATYDQALSVYTRARSPGHWAAIQNNRGLALSERVAGDRAQNIDDAIAAYQQAAAVHAGRPSLHQWAETQSNLGRALTSRTRGSRALNIEQAIAAFEDALSVTTVEEFPDLWATIQGNLANAKQERIHGLEADNIDAAIKGYQTALTVHTKDAYPEDWARLQANLGAAFRSRLWGSRSDNLELAISAYQQALTVLTHSAYPERWAFVSMNLGHVYQRRLLGDVGDNFDRAMAAYEDAATIYDRESEPDNWATLQANIGTAYLATRSGSRNENLARAMQHLRAALSYIGSDTRPREYLLISRSLGRLMAARSEWVQALEQYKAGIATFRSLLGTGFDETDARDVIGSAGYLFAEAAYAAVKLGDSRQAFALLEDGKAKLLGFSLRLDTLPLTDEQRARRADLTAQLRAAERSDQSAGGARRRENLQALKTIRQELLDLLSAAQGPDAGTRGAEERLTDVLRPGQAIVAPVITDEGGFILVAAPHDGGIRFSTLDVPGLTIRQVDEFAVGREGVTTLGGWFGAYSTNYLPPREQRRKWKEWLDAVEALGVSLWALVGKAIAEALAVADIQRGAEIIVLPQGTLGILPIGLAQDPQSARRLMDDYVVTYAPSLAALAAIHDRLASHKRDAPPTLAAIINPTSDLKFSSIEGALIKRHFSSEGMVVLERDDAAADAVVSALKGRDYWHFASHGKFNWMDARASGLLLKGNEVLSVGSLLEVSELGTPRLAVLSACETGLHDTFRAPEEFYGLPAAFVQLGAAAVLSALWPVDDLSTALLVSRFYDFHLDQGLTPAAALQSAQVWLRSADIESLQEYVLAAVRAGHLASDVASTLGRLGWESNEPDHLSWFRHQRPFEHPFFWGGFILTGR